MQRTKSRCLNQASKKRSSLACSSSSLVNVVRSGRVDPPMYRTSSIARRGCGIWPTSLRGRSAFHPLGLTTNMPKASSASAASTIA